MRKNIHGILIAFSLLILSSNTTLFAQVLITDGTNTTPDASAVLDVESTNKGMLIPRISLTGTTDITTISNPATSLLVYNTTTISDVVPGFYYFDGTAWTTFSGSSILGWSTSGNTGTTNGTDFIGTIDSVALDFRADNVIKARLTTKGQLEFLNTGSSVFIGEGAGANDDLSANLNVFLGYQAGYANTTGVQNSATGYQALRANTTGSFNTGTGYISLYNNTTGNLNTATGYQALRANTIGIRNGANGAFALFSNTEGSYNNGNGGHTLYSNTTGTGNTAAGDVALYANTTGNFNTATGYQALRFNTTGSNNTAIGKSAGFNALGDGNIFLGYHAGYNETGSNQLYIANSNTASPLIYGDFATSLLRVNGTLNINNAYSFPTADGTAGEVLTTDGVGNVTWAAAAGGTATAWALTGNALTVNGTNFIGTTDAQALDFRTNNVIKARLTTKGQLEFLNTGSSVFIGEGAGANDDLSANENVFVGSQAGNANTTGSWNNAIGSQALFRNTTGVRNSAAGYQALYSNTTGIRNTAAGYQALYSNTTGFQNNAIGDGTLYSNTIGSWNTANGYFVLGFNTTGGYNTGNGAYTLFSNTTGSYNTALGYNAFNTGANYSNSMTLGYNAAMNGSNRIHLGNTSITEIKGQVNFTTYSDARIKDNVTEDVAGLDFINRLRPVTYNFNVDRQNELMGIVDESEYDEKYALERIKFSGFLAQEVEQAAEESGYDFSGVKVPKEEKELYGVSYAEFTVPLVKAVQELSKENEIMKAEINRLKVVETEQKIMKVELAEIKALLNAKTTK